VPHGDWYLLSKRRSRWPGRSAGCRPIPSNRARQKARQPASPRPRTRSSNPVPSSEESANHQFLSSGAHHCGRLDRKTELNDPDWTVGVKLGRDDKRGFWLLDVVRARASLSSQHAVRIRAASTNWASDRSPPPDNRIRLRDSETRVEAITNFEYLHAGLQSCTFRMVARGHDAPAVELVDRPQIAMAVPPSRRSLRAGRRRLRGLHDRVQNRPRADSRIGLRRCHPLE